jgi:hypothetical protein
MCFVREISEWKRTFTTASILPISAKTTVICWLGSSGPCGVMDMKKELWYVGRVGKARNCVDVLVGLVWVEVREGELGTFCRTNSGGQAISILFVIMAIVVERKILSKDRRFVR